MRPLGVCAGRPSHLTETQVLAAAAPAMETKFPEGFEADRSYHAEFRDGAWWAQGTLPTKDNGAAGFLGIESGELTK